jgi:hypothetical protein
VRHCLSSKLCSSKTCFGHIFLSFIMDLKKIIIWNVRGLNSRSRQDVVRTLVDLARVDAGADLGLGPLGPRPWATPWPKTTLI